MSDAADDDPQWPSSEADLFDDPTFARTYVATFVLRVAGTIAFVGGCGIALLDRRAGGVFVVAGAALLVVGSVASSVSAYRVLSPLGYGSFAAWSRSRPWASASLSRYREYRELLRDES
jgi:hypothetical protein